MMPDPSILSLSLGVFCDWGLPTKKDWEFINKAGFDEVIVGIDETDFHSRHFTPKLGTEYTNLSTNACGAMTYAMCWVVRSRTWVQEAIPAIVRIAKTIGAEGVVLDLEEDALKPEKIDPQDFADAVVSTFEASCRVEDVELDLIACSYITVYDQVAPLIAMCDFGCPMAYSFWKPVQGEHWTHNNSTFPGLMQAKAFENWSKHIDPHKITMGLGNYNGSRPKSSGISITHEQSLRWSAAETSGLGVHYAWYWSLKHFMKKTREGETNCKFLGVE